MGMVYGATGLSATVLKFRVAETVTNSSSASRVLSELPLGRHLDPDPSSCLEVPLILKLHAILSFFSFPPPNCHYLPVCQKGCCGSKALKENREESFKRRLGYRVQVLLCVASTDVFFFYGFLIPFPSHLLEEM